jgi:hypothetical protein
VVELIALPSSGRTSMKPEAILQFGCMALPVPLRGVIVLD